VYKIIATSNVAYSLLDTANLPFTSSSLSPKHKVIFCVRWVQVVEVTKTKFDKVSLVTNFGHYINLFFPSTAFLRGKKAKGWLGMVGKLGRGS
jgi:hypothetical protein